MSKEKLVLHIRGLLPQPEILQITRGEGEGGALVLVPPQSGYLSRSPNAEAPPTACPPSGISIDTQRPGLYLPPVGRAPGRGGAHWARRREGD